MDATYQAEKIDPQDLERIVRDALSELVPPEVIADGQSERERDEPIRAIESVS